MGIINKLLFSDRAPLLMKRSLDMLARRQSVTASNIANIDTPGYKAKELKFEESLRSAVQNSGGQLAVTDKRHIKTSGNDQIKNLASGIEASKDIGRIDGNNVDLEKEMAILTETQLRYDATAQMFSKRGSTVGSAIRDIR